MRHSFILTNDSNKCNKCGRPEIDHTDFATCESCPNVGPCDLYPDIKGILLCKPCEDKEELIRMSPEKAEERIKQLSERSERSALHHVIEINNSVQTRSDVFNAKTVSIIELKKLIDSDTEIQDKHFKLAEVLTVQLNQLKSAIFSKGEELTVLNNEQNAVQTYLNTLSNKLRVEQREAIKLADLSYQPNPTKIKAPKATPVARKFDKAELVKYANESGFPIQVLQQVCISKNMTPSQASIHLTKVMSGIESKSDS